MANAPGVKVLSMTPLAYGKGGKGWQHVKRRLPGRAVGWKADAPGVKVLLRAGLEGARVGSGMEAVRMRRPTHARQRSTLT